MIGLNESKNDDEFIFIVDNLVDFTNMIQMLPIMLINCKGV